MNEKPLTGPEFIKMVEPKKDGSVIRFADKKTIFNALFEARGTGVSADHLSPPSDKESINVSRAQVNAAWARIRIFSGAYDVTDSHYVDIALDAYLKRGGKYNEFAQELDVHKKAYEQHQQNRLPPARPNLEPVRNSISA